MKILMLYTVEDMPRMMSAAPVTDFHLALTDQAWRDPTIEHTAPKVRKFAGITRSW